MFHVIKTMPAPASLEKEGSYSSKDVIEQLARDFHNKCYICEIKDPISLNVEHFKPHKNIDDEKKYDWSNLFFACARCNNIKRSKYDNILDCTSKDINVLMAVKHEFPLTAHAREVKITAMFNDEKTKMTASLLDEVFNSESTGNKELSRTYLLKRLMSQYRKFLELLWQYDDEDTIEEERIIIEKRIANMLKVEYEFSAFLRWSIIESPKLHHFRNGVF
ncbi:hypothetical protein DDT52_19985 [Brenneria roseae subsp. roseae]|uniref:HNH endonuclease n=1 Tax=Brenneria roseae TaxID=1509241 RepID=UPI000D60CC52|nr:HNH endonuclease [Brenneria roseae]PWC15467.1 hypothetical protein DDT52_19985 [Brenneria roseae subsp. roseae]